MRSIYRRYVDAGRDAEVPMMIFTPTWRANPERMRLAGFVGKQINRDAVEFLMNIREEYGEYSGKILIGGLMGCRGNAYDPEDSLSAEDAFHFHAPQARELAGAGVDFLIASTLPSISEAAGMARAMTVVGESILSFVIRRDGCLLDGTSLVDAVRIIDSSVSARPAGYMVNCVHPLVFLEAMEKLRWRDTELKERLIGLQANPSQKPPEELDGSSELISEDPEIFGEEMDRVRRLFELRIVGGCCGTDDRHIRKVASLMRGRNL
jgi:homocysteine S-methyltransferase